MQLEKQFIERSKDAEFERRLKSIDLEDDDEEAPKTEGKKPAAATKGNKK